MSNSQGMTMTKKRTQNNRKLCHIPQPIYNEITLFGNQNFQQGLRKTKSIVHCLNFTIDKNNGFNQIKLETIRKQVFMCMKLIRVLYPQKYETLKYLPEFIEQFLENDRLNFDILKCDKGGKPRRDAVVEDFDKKGVKQE